MISYCDNFTIKIIIDNFRLTKRCKENLKNWRKKTLNCKKERCLHNFAWISETVCVWHEIDHSICIQRLIRWKSELETLTCEAVEIRKCQFILIQGMEWVLRQINALMWYLFFLFLCLRPSLCPFLSLFPISLVLVFPVYLWIKFVSIVFNFETYESNWILDFTPVEKFLCKSTQMLPKVIIPDMESEMRTKKKTNNQHKKEKQITEWQLDCEPKQSPNLTSTLALILFDLVNMHIFRPTTKM